MYLHMEKMEIVLQLYNSILDSEGDHDKISKKDLLIGRRKDKKDKGKDRGYAALEGESSPEEELDAKY